MKFYRTILFSWTLLLMSAVVNCAGWIYVLSHSHTMQKWIAGDTRREGLLLGAYFPLLLCLLGAVVLTRKYWEMRRRDNWYGTALACMCSVVMISLLLISMPEVLLFTGATFYVLSLGFNLLLVGVLSLVFIYVGFKV